MSVVFQLAPHIFTFLIVNIKPVNNITTDNGTIEFTFLIVNIKQKGNELYIIDAINLHSS